MAKILLIDDDPGVLYMLRAVLEDRGHETIPASSGQEGLGKLDGADLAITDLSMPGMDGIEVMKAIRAKDERLPIILLTAHGSERIAVAAMKAGAYDYLTKPFDVDELGLCVDRALEVRKLRDNARRLTAEQAIGKRLVGSSGPMQRLLSSIDRVANKDVTVLVTGETGTGKELVGALIHAESQRAKGPLVRFNCAAIPEELADAELFGHARGAFTGAQSSRRGFFAQADGGTLVLDEIGELPLAIQAKLLRAIQEGEIQPVGSGRVEKVDVRIVATTNRDLAAESRSGRFREDLYYRLAVVELTVPPLRERREDIPALAEEFARRYGEKFGLDDVRLSPALVGILEGAHWPGNVRQLENSIARMVALSSGGVLDASAWQAPQVRGEPGAALDDQSLPTTEGPSLKEQVEAFERNLIQRALTAARGNQSEAARRLGMSRPTLIDKIKKYALQSVGSDG